MKLTIEKRVCPKCNGFKFIDDTNIIGFESPKTTTDICPLCEGEGLIIVRTVKETEKNIKKK